MINFPDITSSCFMNFQLLITDVFTTNLFDNKNVPNFINGHISLNNGQILKIQSSADTGKFSLSNPMENF